MVGAFQCGAVAGKTAVLGDHVLGAADIGDTFTTGFDQTTGGIVGDLEFVRFDAGECVVRVGGIHQHDRIIGQTFRHGGDAVRHLRIEEAVHAVPLQCGDLAFLAGLSVGADGDQHIAVGAGRILSTQNDAACVRSGRDLFADESEDAGLAGTKASRQRIGLIPQIGGGLTNALRDVGLDTPDIAFIEHQGNGGYGHTGLFGNFLHRRHKGNTIPSLIPEDCIS